MMRVTIGENKDLIQQPLGFSLELLLSQSKAHLVLRPPKLHLLLNKFAFKQKMPQNM